MVKILKILFFWQLIVLTFSRAAFGFEFNRVSVSPLSFEGLNKNFRSWFVYKLTPGASVENGVVIQNKNPEPISVELYAVDATTTSDGAFTLKNEGEIEDAGGWIRLSKRKVRVSGNSKETVPFTLKVPVRATPGDHVAGIAVIPGDAGTRIETGLKVINRVGIRFYINVEGAVREDLVLSSLNIKKVGGDRYLSYSLTNSGNTNLNIKAETGIKSLFGFQNLNLGNIGEVLAGRTVKREIKVSGMNPFPLLIDFDLAYGASNKKLLRTVVVWENIAIFVLAIGTLLIVPLLVFKRTILRNR